MAIDREALSAMLQDLRSGENVVSTLQSLNSLLEATPSSAEVLEIASFLSLRVLFNYLSTTDNDQIQACCPVVDKIFSKMPVADICQYGQYFELGLQHTSEDVRKMTLRILRTNSSHAELQAMVVAPTVLHLITQVLGDSSLECATLATEIFLKVVKNPLELDVKIRQAFLVDLEGLLSMSDIVRYRVYELVVKMALSGGDAFGFVQSSGLLQRLVKELDLEDILVKMNCIELLVTLMESSEGMQFLESEQVVRRLHTQLLSAQQDPIGGLIIPGVECPDFVLFRALTCIYNADHTVVHCKKLQPYFGYLSCIPFVYVTHKFQGVVRICSQEASLFC